MSESQSDQGPTTTPIQNAQLFKALALAQGAFPPIPKDCEVEVYNKERTKLLYTFMYADLTTIIDKTRPALSQNGLSFTQSCIPGGFVTTIMHESGESLKCGFIPLEIPKGMDMKVVGGLITYVKRYSLSAALGVSADEDVDAAAMESRHGNSTTKTPNSKVENKQSSQKTTKPQSPNLAPASQEMIDTIYSLAIERQVSEGVLNYLLRDGYGVNTRFPPVWISREVTKLLENEDCTEATVMAEAQRVLSRREAKRIKDEQTRAEQI